MQANYFFIDGSALTAQIRHLRRANESFKGRKLCPIRLMSHFIEALPELHQGDYKRATFYFPSGDESAVEEYLLVPDHKKPGEIRDIYFKFCGQKLKRSSEFREFVETNIPEKWHNYCSKSEKGIDIEICCDGLKLASSSRLERLFLLTNDDDFIPFCRTIKEFGANISILHLSEFVQPNSSLLRECDTYDVVPLHILQQIFLPIPITTSQPVVLPPAEEVVSALKPEASPSDLAIATNTSATVSDDQPISSEPEAGHESE